MSVRPERPFRLALVLAVLIGGLLPAAVSAATVTVHMAGGLSPRSITVAPGTTVRWVNDSDDRHRMRSRNGPVEFDSGNIEPGESFTFTFGAVGTYPYLDDRDRDDAEFHGTVIVAEPSAGGGSGSGGGGGSGGGAPAPAEHAPSAATVHMAGRAFSPGTVTIAAGGSVTFLNDDDREHTATGDAFDTGVLNSGARSTQAFPSAGTFSFLCQIHPEMRGTVAVQDASGIAPPPDAATPIPATPAPTAPPPTATEIAVAIVDFAFDQPIVEVAAGTTVTWTNRGAAPHTVTANSGEFDSGLIAAGSGFTRRFDAPGRFTYVCSFHPDMVGTVVVATASGASPIPSPTSTAPASPDASPSASPDNGGGNVAAAPPAAGPQEPPAQPISAQATEGFLRLLLVAIIVAGGIVAFGVLVVTSARPNRVRR
jgi:plastocyanin